MPYRLFILTFLFFVSFSLFAQIGIGEWREHLPYNQVISLTQDQNRVYCATPFSIFYFDKSEQSIQKLNTINKLSDIGVCALGFDAENKTLIIGYENGNIDLMIDDKVFNMADIKRKPLVGSKKINHIFIHDGLAYLSTDFAIVVIDVKRKEIKDTYFIGDNASSLKINQCYIQDSTLYSVTEKGLFFSRMDGRNLADFQNWQQDIMLIHKDLEYNFITSYKNQIILSLKGSIYSSDTLYVKTLIGWQKFLPHLHGPFTVVKGIGDTLILGSEYGMVYYYNYLADSFLLYDYNQQGYGQIMPRPNDAIIDHKGVVWIGDKVYALVENSKAWNYRFIIPSGPVSKFAWDMSIENQRLWVVSGGYQTTGANNYSRQGAFEFYDNNWKSIYPGFSSFLDTIDDLVSVAINPSNNKEVFIGTWGQGLLQLVDGKLIKSYNQSNSSLEVAINRAGFIGISALTFDLDGNLWVSNTATPNGLSKLSPAGKWQSYNLAPYVTEDMTGDILIDDLDQKWMILQRGKGILVYNENYTIDNQNDDKKTLLNGNTGTGGLPSSTVYCMAKDLDGEVWVGTAAGVAVFYSPELIFSGYEYDAQQIYVPQSGISQYLLESEEVVAIAIDGANRKWLGTRNAGVFLMSEDGTKQIHNFTVDNSPILSNTILDVKIDHISGEVFFATENGIISYRGDATLGNENHDLVKVFPNPVRPDYLGLITISGLVANANVKITDIAGNLVFEMVANGGTAIWNGKNINGQRVASGVYLVFSTDDQGEEKKVSKILFIN